MSGLQKQHESRTVNPHNVDRNKSKKQMTMAEIDVRHDRQESTHRLATHRSHGLAC
jgi:hypothetical protein